MRKAKRNKSIDKRIYFLCFAFLIILFSPPPVGCATTAEEKQDVIRCISFSSDGKKILFDRGNGSTLLMIHAYDLETGELIAYRQPLGERWGFPRYSFDGKHITFIKMPLIGHKENLANAQIAVMDSDGKNVRIITNTTGLKVFPSFSHSGRKILFARADAIREKGARTPAADFDVYEVDVETGRETRLTQFKFFRMSKPCYFPDDKKFIVWAEAPMAYPGIPNSDKNPAIMGKINKELHAKYKKNSIYVMQGNETELKPYLVTPDYQRQFKMYVADSEYSRSPALSGDGSVLIFVAMGYTPDGSADWEQLYQYSADGNHRRITHFHALPIWEETVSHNGKLVAVIHNVASSRNIKNIGIYQVEDETGREITLPDQPSRIIDSQ